MPVRVLASVLLILLVAVSGHAQVTVIGHLSSGPDAVTIDSAQFVYGGQDTWFMTPGWHAEPASTDTFEFPLFAGFPTRVQLSADIGGRRVFQVFKDIAHQTWYQFEPPYELTKAMFDDLSGIEEVKPGPVRAHLVVSPNLVRDVATISTSGTGCLEIVDAVGNTVRSLPAAATVRWSADDNRGKPLPEGIYFCRLTVGQTATVRKLTLAR